MADGTTARSAAGNPGCIFSALPSRLNFATWALDLPLFALEHSRALQILRTLSRAPEVPGVGFDIRPIDPDLMRAAGAESGGGAAIFPDGSAAFTRRDLD